MTREEFEALEAKFDNVVEFFTQRVKESEGEVLELARWNGAIRVDFQMFQC